MVKKLFYILMISIMALTSVSAVTQHNYMKWDFEAGAGSIAQDGSGNNNIGILNGNIGYTATAKFGSFATTYDNTNNYIIGNIYQVPIPDVTSYSIWVYPTGTEADVPLAVYDDNFIMQFGINYDVNGVKGIWYYDNALVYQSVTFANDINTINTWYNLLLEVNMLNDTIKLYRDGVLLGTASTPNLLRTAYTWNIVVGTDQYQNGDFTGNIDAVGFYDFAFNSTQLTQLLTLNNVTLISDNGIEPEVNQTTTLDLINSTSIISGQIFQDKNVELIVNLNTKADCEIYFDSSLYDLSKDLLNFKTTKEFTFGNHNYMVYCEKIVNDTKYYDVTPLIPFSTQMGQKAVEFYFYNINNEHLLGEDYYFVTPCFESLSPYWTYENEYYIKNIKDGYVQFNLSYTADYEFCLYRGTINYNQELDRFNNNFDIVEIKNSIELGNIFVGENTTSYQLKLTNEDIYKPTEPEFWGKTWASLFSFVAGILIGGALILLGMYAKNDKLMVVGGFIIMTGLGVSVWTFVGAIF